MFCKTATTKRFRLCHNVKHRPLVAAAIVLLGGVAAWLLLRPTAVVPASLFDRMEFHCPPAAAERLQQALRQKENQAVFLRQPVNRLFPARPWLGRVKSGDVSYQAAFAAADCSYRLTIRPQEGAKVALGMFSGPGSDLRFTVRAVSGKKTTELSAARLAGPGMREARIDLAAFAGKTVTLEFSTSGRGLGAWLAPTMITPREKPRVVIVLVLDTLRADHLPLYGYTRDTAPRLSTLAADSRVFRRAFSTTSWTLPAHVSLFSGCSLAQHGVTAPEHRIPDTLPMLAETFQKNGFVTAAFTGGGFVDDSYGFHRGFQLYSTIPGETFSTVSAERVFKHFRDFFAAYINQDCFIFLHTYQLHAPYKAPSPFRTAFNGSLPADFNLRGVSNFLSLPREVFRELPSTDRQQLIDLYDGGIRYCDQELLGRLLDHLRGLGLYDNALLTVLSDHGEEFYDHGGWEHGHTLYSEQLHIPLVIKYPQRANRGEETALTSIADLPFLILEGIGRTRDAALFRAADFAAADRRLQAGLPASPTIRDLPARISFLEGPYQYIRNFQEGTASELFTPSLRLPPAEVYDLSADPRERRNLTSGPGGALRGRLEKAARDYLARLRAAAGAAQALDPELQERLRSLGYFQK